MRQKPTRFPYSCHAQLGTSGIGDPSAGGGNTVRGSCSSGFHSSTLTITHTARRRPPGRRGRGGPTTGEYVKRSGGSIGVSISNSGPPRWSPMIRDTAYITSRFSPWANAGRLVDDLAVDDCQHRPDLLDLDVGHREIVPVQNRQIRKLAWLDGAKPVLHLQMPTAFARAKTECLLASEMLIGVDLLPERVHAGDDVVEMQPRVQRRDVGGVAEQALVDRVLIDRAIRMTRDDIGGARVHPVVRRQLDAAAEPLEPVKQIAGHPADAATQEVHIPPQAGNADFLVHVLELFDQLRQCFQVLGVVVAAPSSLRAERLCRA